MKKRKEKRNRDFFFKTRQPPFLFVSPHAGRTLHAGWASKNTPPAVTLAPDRKHFGFDGYLTPQRRRKHKGVEG